MAFKGTPIVIRDSDSEKDASTPANLKARKQGLPAKSKVKVEEKQHQGGNHQFVVCQPEKKHSFFSSRSNQDLIPQNKEKFEQNSGRLKPRLKPNKKSLDRFLTYPQYIVGKNRKDFPGPQGCRGSNLVLQEAGTTSASMDVAHKEQKMMKDVAQEEQKKMKDVAQDEQKKMKDVAQDEQNVQAATPNRKRRHPVSVGHMLQPSFGTKFVCILIPHHLQSSLPIPDKFVECLSCGELRHHTVNLHVGRICSWSVKLRSSGHKMFLSEGWVGFVKDAKLSVGYILHFDVVWPDYWEVIVFNPSLVEAPLRCDHKDHDV